MMKQTALYQKHQSLGAVLVDFANWQMPMHYGSQLAEHHSVRKQAGMFDVGHMVIVDITGVDAKSFMRYLVANDVSKLKENQALYGCLLNEAGGIIDDLIVYYLANNFYRIVINAACCQKDIAWLKKCCVDFDVDIEQRQDLSILALQGPKSYPLLKKALPELPADIYQLNRFFSYVFGDWLIATTGYTGEIGFEIMLPNHIIADVWQKLYQVGVAPCGLAARDTLRLEAGMHLYGKDMNEETSPLESGLAWTIDNRDSQRQFIGKQALAKKPIKQKLIAIVLQEKGVLRSGQIVHTSAGLGEITSGGFSPTMAKGIGFARVPIDAGQDLTVEMRQKRIKISSVKAPFVREGQVLVSI